MAMFFAETLALGILAGTLGALAGAGFVGWLGSVGISANNQDILIFLFGGPRLFPTVSLGNLVFAFCVVVIVSVASTLYPARLATRIQPVVAMQAKE
jgi:ABC-type lipoprotein release transport system permease subunit